MEPGWRVGTEALEIAKHSPIRDLVSVIENSDDVSRRRPSIAEPAEQPADRVPVALDRPRHHPQRFEPHSQVLNQHITVVGPPIDVQPRRENIGTTRDQVRTSTVLPVPGGAQISVTARVPA